MKTRVAVMFGGKSVEHEVSVISGIQAIHNISRDKYEVIPVYISKKNEMYMGDDIADIEAYKNIDALIAKSTRVILVNAEDKICFVNYPQKKFGKNLSVEIDVAFPIVHGTNVEDGALQGYLKTIGVPFVGCDVTASAVGMEKHMCKAVLRESGIPMLECRSFTLADYKNVDKIVSEIEASVGYPVIIKPVNLGSSVGISVASDRTELEKSIDDAFMYAKKIIAEHAITKLREINCSVLGNEKEAEASECEEPLHTAEILSYEDKYMSGSKDGGSKGMASVSRKIPAELSPEMRERVRSLAVKAFKALGCCGVSRIDFMIDEETGKLYFNEINTIPGSLAFYLWEPLGVPYSELLDRLIQLSLARVREESALTFSFETNILNNRSFSGSKGSKLNGGKL